MTSFSFGVAVAAFFLMSSYFAGDHEYPCVVHDILGTFNRTLIQLMFQ